jgi:hypothetical protein
MSDPKWRITVERIDDVTNRVDEGSRYLSESTLKAQTVPAGLAVGMAAVDAWRDVLEHRLSHPDPSETFDAGVLDAIMGPIEE